MPQAYLGPGIGLLIGTAVCARTIDRWYTKVGSFLAVKQVNQLRYVVESSK